MTLASLLADVNDALCKDLYANARAFYAGLHVTERTLGFRLQDVMDAIAPPKGAKDWAVRIRGHFVEVSICRPDITLFFGCGGLWMGFDMIEMGGFEESVETLRHIIALLPRLHERYEERKAEAELAVRKEEMTEDIALATVNGLVAGFLDRSLFCVETERTDRCMYVNVVTLDGLPFMYQSFRIRYHSMEEDVDIARLWHDEARRTLLNGWQ